MSTVQHRRAQEYLERGISSGAYAEGELLPAVEELAALAGVSEHAMRRAIRSLGDLGILWSVRKRGTRVLRRPVVGRVLFMNSWDAHTNLLFQEAIGHALIHANLRTEFLPFIFHAGVGFANLRHLAGKEAGETVLLTLAQESIPAASRPAWEEFARRFRYRVGFQFEETRLLLNSLTLLPDPEVAAGLVAEHLLALGHRRIGVVAGGSPDDGSAPERRAAALAAKVRAAGAECHLYHYNLHAVRGVPAFVRETGCTAWWAINDHQALDHVLQFQQAGLNVPADLSVMGCNDTPWATSGALPLTTLSLDPPQVAATLAAAAETILRHPDEATASRVVHVRPYLVPRASTAAPPADCGVRNTQENQP